MFCIAGSADEYKYVMIIEAKKGVYKKAHEEKSGAFYITEASDITYLFREAQI